MAGELLVFVLEGLELSLAVEMPLHVGDVRVFRAVPLHLIEDLEKHRQDRLPSGPRVGPAVDVEEDDVGVAVDGLLDVGEHQLVADLLLEELDGLLALTAVLVGLVAEDVAEDLDEVRFAGAKEARHPDADLAGDVDVLGVVDALDVGAEELPDVAVELAGDDKLVELLPDGGLVDLVGFDHAVDRSKDVLREQVTDTHRRRS